jgi:plasmid maintenance system antidote protein VapI
MSLLNKLGKVQQLNKIDAATARVAAPLFDTHPIVNEPEDFRLQYLAAVALGVAVDREMTDNERLRWHGLARALGLDETEASDQLNGREDMSEQDIARIFKTLNVKQLEWTYLLDVAWQQMADGPAVVQVKWPPKGTGKKELGKPEIKVIETIEDQTMKALAGLLSIKTSENLRFLHELVLAVSSQDFIRAVMYARNLPEQLDTKEIKNIFRFQRYEVVTLKVRHHKGGFSLIGHCFISMPSGKIVQAGEQIVHFKNMMGVITPHAGVVARYLENIERPKVGQTWGTLYRTEFDD